MTAKELFDLNADFAHSPLVATARKLHALFEASQVPYCIIGGMAVARNGAMRTTHDIDVLTERAGWERLRSSPGTRLELQADSATDTETGVRIDVLFAGDDWQLVFPMPHPAGVSEHDSSLGARFMDLLHTMELKCAVYLAKRREHGIEVAAKDLADVVELMRHNRERLGLRSFDAVHPRLRRELRRIWRKVQRAPDPRFPRRSR